MAGINLINNDMKALYYFFVFFMCVGFTACTSDDVVNNYYEGIEGSIKSVNVTLPEWGKDASTRTAFDISESGVNAVWADGDIIGIFPNQGSQVEFPINVGGSNKATFNGGGWGLKSGNTYAAYYPFNKMNYDKDATSIILDYTGQTQRGNNNYDHLSAYDYLASGAVNSINNSVSFDMQRLGSLVAIELELPEPAIYESVTLVSEAGFVKRAKLNISGEQPEVYDMEVSKSITLLLENVETTSENETVIFYMMLYPMDYATYPISVQLYGKSHPITIYEEYHWAKTILDGKQLEAGKPYRFSHDSSMETEGFVGFHHVAVREIALEKWDTNFDGGVSEEEAAAVTMIDPWLFYHVDNFLYENPMGRLPNLQTIGEGAFSWAHYNGWVDMPNSVVTIEDNAFSSNPDLVGVSFSGNLKTIGAYAFANCQRLNSVFFNEGLETIGEGAFDQCHTIKELNIPTSVTTIGARAFCDVNQITSVIIPDGITRLEENVFGGCNSLESVTLPVGLEYIGTWAFNECWPLKEIAFPNSLTYIADVAFHNCRSLKSLTIPENVGFIGNSAFYACSGLKYVRMLSETPPTLEVEPNDGNYYVFNETNDCPIYVPEGSVDAYKSAAGWSSYADRIQAYQEGIEDGDGDVGNPNMGDWN